MAPILPELLSQVVYSFKGYDWPPLTANTSEQLIQTADSNILSVIWAWISGVFASVGVLFVSSWPIFGDGDAIKDHLWEWFVKKLWNTFSEFLLRPEIHNALIVWFAVFWLCMLILLALGFGPTGVIAGLLATWVQSTVYKTFTPAGGLFAVMVSVGVMGIARPRLVKPPALIATLASWVAWWMTIA